MCVLLTAGPQIAAQGSTIDPAPVKPGQAAPVVSFVQRAVPQTGSPSLSKKQNRLPGLFSGHRIEPAPPQEFCVAAQPSERSGLHTPARQTPPLLHAAPLVRSRHVPPLQVWHSPQSASTQQAPGGRHCLPHFTFGDVHFFFLRFLRAALPDRRPPPGSSAKALPTRSLRRDRVARNCARSSRWLEGTSNSQRSLLCGDDHPGV